MARTKGKRLTNKERREIQHALTLNFNNGRLKHGIMKALAMEYGVQRWAIQRLWSNISRQIKDGKVPSIDRQFKGAKPSLNIDLEKVRNIPLSNRTNLDGLSLKLGCTVSALQRLIKKGKIRSHTSATKPFLTQENMIARIKFMNARIKFVLSKIQPQTFHENLVFQPMYESIHIDETWFYMTKASERYYLLPDEEEPHRCLKSKRFITKVMFMAAVGRPMYAEDGMLLWDWKIWIFPFTVEVPAKQASKNREKGVLQVKPIASITKEVIRYCLIQKVIPAVKAKWPNGRSKVIVIQQDNAKPHIKINDKEFIAAAQSNGFLITLECQPPNSPDLNILDLGFFRPIQKIQYEKAPKSVSALVDAVTKAYDECNPKCLHYNWLSLQYCMNEILRVKGNNNYKLPHVEVQPTKEYVTIVLQHLEEIGHVGVREGSRQSGEASERVIREEEIIGNEGDA
ncbi:hypothetical protein RND81_03G173200 [Saponaria officinalis]|uniref:DUF7769 domain-containing protein n=1 Tax=Saponaria officinalis TaxID=3572 RepID=A0AAW1M4Q8_SAPOF